MAIFIYLDTKQTSLEFFLILKVWIKIQFREKNRLKSGFKGIWSWHKLVESRLNIWLFEWKRENEKQKF